MAELASRRIPAAVVELRACRGQAKAARPQPAPQPAERTCFIPDDVRRAALELEAQAGRVSRTLSRHFTTPAALAEAQTALAGIEAQAKAARKALRKAVR